MKASLAINNPRCCERCGAPVRKSRNRFCSIRCGRLKHGEVGMYRYPQVNQTAEYRAWQCMLTRCYNPNRNGYERYGGRGISVCDRWRGSFELFLIDVGRRPSTEHSLDRYPDNNGNYEPGNVRWATRKQQGGNQGSNRIFDVGGERMIMSDACVKYGINISTFRSRIKLMWSVPQALGIEAPPRFPRGRHAKRFAKAIGNKGAV